MRKNPAVSEIIGAILLIGIIVGAFGIFAALYLPTIKPVVIPQVTISIACAPPDANNDDVEFPCTRASFSDHPFDNRTCENNCRAKDYAENPQITSDQQQIQMIRCMENCIKPMSSNLTTCKYLYLCHLGGDTLQISDMRVVINGNNIDPIQYKCEIKKQNNNFTELSALPDDITFGNGDSLRIDNGYIPVNKVMVIYSVPSGGEIPLVMNQFGTDV